tara:strand:+ start:119 stop:2323 length:2205 start_codon:yes stop_codon:yes gene_type:complete
MSLTLIKSQNFSLVQQNSIQVIVNNDTLDNPWTGGFNSAQISKIDLNNDQIEDLFVFDRSCDKVITYISSNNKFVYAPEYEKKFPSSLKNWVLLRDYNGDGKKDIFSFVSGGIGVWKNTSNFNEISFAQQSFFQSSINSFVSYLLSFQYNNDYNIYVISSDIPSISDIDNDGDLDILNFGVQGSRIEYHQNQALQIGNLDTLAFEMKNTCWGHFSESGLSNTCTLFDTCFQNVPNPHDSTIILRNNLRHSGSTVLALNLNNDQVKDIILGDVSYSNIVALYNDNKGINMNTSFISQDTSFPNYSVPADLHLFPGVFHEDVDHDGMKDLLVSPNSNSDAEDKNSIWFYKNFGNNQVPQFYLQDQNFLQNNTIEVGRESKPIFVDINNDQIEDLLVANFGEFDLSIPSHYRSYIESYINVGTQQNPVFSKSSNDFQNISTLINEINLIPSFGDLDNDGDLDAVIGDYSGKLHYLENTSSNPSIINLSIGASPMNDVLSNTFDFGFNAHPTLFDVDNDNDLDIIVGEAIGNLNFVENVGDSINFNFDLRSENFGGVDVSEWWTNIGISSPVFYRNGSDIELYVGSKRGAIYKYNNIDNNLSGNFNLVDSNFNNIFAGTHSTPAISDLNNDSLIDFIIGNKRGGLSLFMGSNDSLISTTRTPYKLENKYEIFPVPARDIINVKNLNKLLYFEVISLTGRKVKTGYTKGTIPISKLNSGIYFLMLEDGIHRNILKFVKC